MLMEDAEGNIVLHTYFTWRGDKDELSHIVACVNALADIPALKLVGDLARNLLQEPVKVKAEKSEDQLMVDLLTAFLNASKELSNAQPQS